jgi:tRNA A-37 threonylcarbamoyl transferase component Bud32
VTQVTDLRDLVLGSRYRVTERIAGGGMGEVWRARDEVLGREVAVKILRREYVDDPTFLARFQAEARHTANLSHPNIAAVYDFGEGDATRPGEAGSPFLVMEHVPGEPLSTIVSREGRLDPASTMDVVGQAALGLQAAHDGGVIHRDVKPGNILVTPSGDVKITDFGIARATDSVPLTQTGAIMGTAYYISPEQASGGSVTPASDIYSLGIVAYECLTGRRPFAGDTPVSVALAQVRDEPPALPQTLPAPVRELVMRMLDKEPGRRPATAGDVGREALEIRDAAAAAAPAPDRTAPTRTIPAGALPDVGGPASTGDVDTDPDRTAAVVAARRVGSDTDPGFHLPDPSRLPRWLPAAVALAVLALLLLLVVRACGPADEVGTTSSTTDSPASSEATAPTTVEVVAGDYLGRPVADVRTELEGLGLQVDVQRTAGGGEIGTVKGVRPTGTVEAGSLVTLEAVAEAPHEPDEDGKGKSGKGNGHGKGKGDE